MRRLEAWLRDNGGFQHTYCDSFQTEAEFEQMFDHAQYDRMRARYGAGAAFPRVYAKVRKTPSWPKSWANFSLL